MSAVVMTETLGWKVPAERCAYGYRRVGSGWSFRIGFSGVDDVEAGYAGPVAVDAHSALPRLVAVLDSDCVAVQVVELDPPARSVAKRGVVAAVHGGFPVLVPGQIIRCGDCGRTDGRTW